MTEKQALVPYRVVLPYVFKSILSSPKNYIWLYGGRVGGKSANTGIVSILTMLNNPYTDVIVARVSYGSMGDSSYAELESAIENSFPQFADEFVMKKSPLRIERKNGSGTIYFIGYGGSNKSRTKSIKTKHPVSVVIFEETQELKEKRNLDEALASFRRRFGENVKVFVLGNPPPQAAHWYNLHTIELKNDPDWQVVNITWKDIVPFINDFDLKEIIKTKLSDYEYYNWFYMGSTSSSFGTVYPMFRPEKHVITLQEWSYCQERFNLRPIACLIGGDGAVNNDCTAFTPLILLNNGQAVVGPLFVHDPKENGVVGYHSLVQDQLVKWFDDLCRMFHLGTVQELRDHPYAKMIPIWITIDNAAPDLIQECRFFIGDRAQIGAVKKMPVPQMVATVQSVLKTDNVYIIDYGGYFNYHKNVFIKRVNWLAEQLSNLVWNEKQDNYDPIVPNDVSDSFTYLCVHWYKNVENLNINMLLRAQGMRILENSQIRVILDKKE